MLTCKNVVVINAENDPKGEKALVVPYDRVYLDFDPADKTEELVKNNKGNPIQLNGQIWKGTRPVKDVTENVAAIPTMFQDAVNYLVSSYGGADEYKALPDDVKGLYILLHAADYGNDLWMRSKIQRESKPPAKIDPAAAREKMAKAMIADAASRGKVLSMEKALARIAALEAAEAEEEAAA